MKKLLLVLIIFLIPFISIPLNAAWIDKGDHKELDRKISGTNVIAFDEAGKYFYTFSGDTCLRKWNYFSAEVTDSLKIKYHGKYLSCFFSSDKKVFGIAYNSGGWDFTNTIIFEAYNLNTFEKLDSAVKTVWNPGGDHGYYVYNYFNKLDYSFNNHYFIIGFGYSQSSTTMGITDYTYNGSLFTISGIDNKQNILAEGFINNFNVYQNQNRSVYITARGYSSDQNDYDYLSVYISDTTFTHSQKIIDYSKSLGSTSTYYEIRNAILNQHDSCAYLTSENSKILRTYDYAAKKFLKEYTMPATTAYWINMSDDSRFLFLPYFNHLRILHPQTKTQIAEFNFDADLISYAYNVENNALISLSKSNTIELRYPEEFVIENDFIVSDTLTYENTPITYYYNGPKKIMKYLWDFGDGTTSEERCPNHSYLNIGTYTVKLNIKDIDNNITDMEKQNLIRIIDTLTADFIVQYQDPKDYHNIVFKNLSKGDIRNITWDFGDGSKIEHSFNANHSYAFDGFYNVSLTIEDEKATKTIIRKVVNVLEVPAILSYVTPQDSIIQGFSKENPSPNSLVNVNFVFEISPNKNYYVNTNWYINTQIGVFSGSRLTISDSTFRQIKDDESIITNYNNKCRWYFDNEGVYLYNGSNFYKYNLLLDTVLKHFTADNYTHFLYIPDSTLLRLYLNPDKKNALLKRYSWQGDSLWSRNLPVYSNHLWDLNKEMILYTGQENSGINFYKYDFNGNLLDTFKISINCNNPKLILTQSGSEIYFENYGNSVMIYKIVDNLLKDSLLLTNYLQIFYDNDYQYAAIQPKLFKEKYIAITGQSPLPGYIILDTNLKIIYNKRFPNVRQKFAQIQIISKNVVQMEYLSFLSSSDTKISILTDTIPDGILDIPDSSDSINDSIPLLSEIQILPNPASDNVEFILPKNTEIGTLKVFNMQSQLIYSKEGIWDRFTLNSQIFPPGVYYCIFTTNKSQKVITQKFIVVR